MAAMDNAAIVRRFNEEMNKGNDAVADEVIAPDLVMHPLWYQPTLLAPPTARGPELIKQGTAVLRRDYPDHQIILDEVLEAGDRVITRYTRRSTHSNGRPVIDQGIIIYRLANGKIVELWWSRDRLGEWQQLGVVPETRDLLAKVGSNFLQAATAQQAPSDQTGQ